ncbi:TRAP transporter substrate-binding protein [Salinicoccus roseus]|uniref:TRAP transporter substrate-binding protein n=1 Tax=Salinicoccus roseus TaxID=45670 RepID=UPI000F517104|nr:TRAP transporter substrate-binding protein [Salinicoccus roseus]RPE51980.1 tripartite ATP-independent transporter DctP family solute receptor [Salinicoccus roseus]GGA74511.1 C4-dicarboxylate ABC transporter [Salinicoccus roseus]
MKRTIITSVLLAIVVILAGCSSGSAPDAGAGEPIKIIAAHNQTSTENPYHDGLLKFKEVAEEESDGRITVEVHAGTIGTAESELVEKLVIGAADVVLVSPGFMTQTGIPEFDFFALPYLFDSYEHWERVVDGPVGADIAEMVNEKSNNDFKMLGYWSAGARHYYGKKPLEEMSDLNGMTIRTQASGVVADFWQQAGAIPTSVAWGELYQALQQNVVDASENAYPYFVQQNHHTTRNGQYITETAHDYTTRFLLANGERFDKYPEDIQQILLEASEASVEAERESLMAQEEEYKEIALEAGAEVNQIDTEPFKEIAAPIQDGLAEELDMEETLEEVRSLE